MKFFLLRIRGDRRRHLGRVQYIIVNGAGSNFLPVLGAFVSDSYLGRYKTILIGCITSFMGMFLLWLTAMIPQVRPPSCDSSSQTCESGIAKTWQLFVLIGAFVLMAIGAGATVPSFAFGADQVNGKDISNKKKLCQVLHTELYLRFLVSSSTHSRIAGSIAGSVVSAIVESIRHSKAIEQGFANNPNAVLDMSAYWLVPQLVIGGIAEAFYAIGQNEFYYSRFDKVCPELPRVYLVCPWLLET